MQNWTPDTRFCDVLKMVNGIIKRISLGNLLGILISMLLLQETALGLEKLSKNGQGTKLRNGALVSKETTQISPADSYEITDGNANLFRLSPERIEYLPVTPALSSSGVYSGGEPRVRIIKTEAFKRLSDLLDRATSRPHPRGEPTNKGTVQIVRIGKDGRSDRANLTQTDGLNTIQELRRLLDGGP
jgi:hypothetical protein